MPRKERRNLTQTRAKALKAEGGREAWAWDAEVRGFGLRALPSGHRSFVLQYRNAEGRTRRLGLGGYPDITVEQARKIARERLAEVLGGEDPAEDRRLARGAVTVAELVDRYVEHELPRTVKPRTLKAITTSLRLYILPGFGSRKVATVTTRDVQQLHNRLEKKPYMANRTLGVLSALMSYAERQGERPSNSNPCHGVTKYRETPRARYLSTEELDRLGTVLKEADESGFNPVAVAGVRFLLMTGLRRNEMLTLKWEYVDWKRQRLNLPDTKSGKRTVALGSSALLLLSQIRDRAEQTGMKATNPYVFPGSKPGGYYHGFKNAWIRLRKKAGLGDCRLHDLRHTYGATAAGLGFSLPMTAKLLGQSSTSVTERYSHIAPQPEQNAAEQVSDELAAIVLADAILTTEKDRAE